MAEHTPGPFHFRIYTNDDARVAQMRELGIEPVRLLTNEGQIALMSGEGEDRKRVALIDCQTHFKRGHGYKTDCAERDANASLFAAAPVMLAAGNELAVAAGDIHPTAPSSKSVDRLHAALDAWGAIFAQATGATP